MDDRNTQGPSSGEKKNKKQGKKAIKNNNPNMNLALAGQKTVYQGPAVILPANGASINRNSNDSSFEAKSSPQHLRD